MTKARLGCTRTRFKRERGDVNDYCGTHLEEDEEHADRARNAVDVECAHVGDGASGPGNEAMSITPCSIVSHFLPLRRSRRFTSGDARRPAAASASARCSTTPVSNLALSFEK
jgi:hypothetical protein